MSTRHEPGFFHDIRVDLGRRPKTKGGIILTDILKGDSRRLPFEPERLVTFIDDVVSEFPTLDATKFKERVLKTIKGKTEFSAAQITETLINNALDETKIEAPGWTYVAASLYSKRLYKEAAKNRSYDATQQYGDFYGLLKRLATDGVYSPTILAKYSRAELKQAGEFIRPERDKLFTYIGLLTLSTRYLATDHEKRVFELPQERWLIIALHLNAKEPKAIRMKLVYEAYWALSNLYMTVATPTLSNAGKSYGQLSSCFIDSVGDSLRDIYDSNTDIATLSKGGGGIGVYMGKIRARGGSIKGFKGLSSGIVPWARQLNNTAVSVDQLGQRQGSIAVYLDVFHMDIFEFLELKLNNGDERVRARDLFTGVCIPDLFMEKVEARADWYLFDPHEVKAVMGFALEDFYDEEEGRGSFRDHYELCVKDNRLSKKVVPAIDIMKSIMKSQLETGTPYMFYRDTVNRMNPNKHMGMIYCSNLCTEIMQNLSETSVTSEITEDGEIIIRKKSGDFVVCNLSSINLGRAVPADVLERLIPIQVRMLDNVIDLNTLEVLQAALTNQKYRAVGLGTFGWHHLLALNGVKWESDEAVQFADELYEKIAFLSIQASNDIAEEKGAYPVFEGSEWETGMYFERRGYVSDKWLSLRNKVKKNGVRNAWIMAIAPNGSTSIIAGSTASIDPIYRREYVEEKKNYRIPVIAPDLSPATFWYYKNAHEVDQVWSLKQNAVRSRHIDQGISFNLYVKNNVKASELLNLHMTAWKTGTKSTYYVRSTSVDIEDCEACAS